MPGMDFHWDWLCSNPEIGIPVLLHRTVEVARLQQSDGVWTALLRYPGREPAYRACTSLESGKAGCELWAERHRAVLMADIDRSFREFRGTVPGLQAGGEKSDRSGNAGNAS